MKKVYFVWLLAAASVIFILTQIYFIRHVPKMSKKIIEEHGGDPGESVSYTNIKSFLDLCQQQDVRSILIDPRILQSVMSSNPNISAPTCKYLCTHHKVTTFAVLPDNFKQEKFDKNLNEKGFKYVTFTETDPRLLGIDNLVTDPIPTHYLTERGGHIIHLLFLYERTGRYWWTGPLVDKYGKQSVSWMTEEGEDQLDEAWKFAAAFDIMEVVSVTLDGLRLNTLRYPLLFLNHMQHARFIECNHQGAKLFHTQYGREKTPQALVFKHKARRQLVKAKGVLDRLKVPFWLSSGTCLGWFRQCDIIAYSKDVDIGIWIKDYNTRLISEFQDAGFKLKHLFGKVADSFELSFQNEDGVKLDIFFFYEDEDSMWNGGTQARTGKKFKYLFPKFHLCWTEFLEMKVRVPCESRAYIEANYGKDWFTPIKTWDWKRSPPNVRENGEWPVEEREHVVQQYDVSS